MTDQATSVWDVIAERMSNKGLSQYALAGLLAVETGGDRETVRKAITRWHKGTTPTGYRHALAAVLGGDPSDYVVNPRDPTPPAAERLARLEAELADARERIAALEAQSQDPPHARGGES